MKQKLLTLAIAYLSFTNVCQAAFPIQAAVNEVTIPVSEMPTTLNSAEMSDFRSAPIIRKTAPAKTKTHNGGTGVFGILSFSIALGGFLIAAAVNSLPLLAVFGISAFILGIIGITGGKTLKGLAIVGMIVGLVSFILAVGTPVDDY
jgi:hypothetical protein